MHFSMAASLLPLAAFAVPAARAIAAPATIMEQQILRMSSSFRRADRWRMADCASAQCAPAARNDDCSGLPELVGRLSRRRHVNRSARLLEPPGEFSPRLFRRETVQRGSGRRHSLVARISHAGKSRNTFLPGIEGHDDLRACPY